MSTSYWLDRSLGKPAKTFDVIVVGAGIAGISTAFWLKKEDPSLKIAVLEKSRLGFGASGRNAGFITCGSVEHFNRLCHKYGNEKAKEIWRFSEVNLDLLKEHVVQDRAEDLLFEQTGSFSLATTDSEIRELGEAAKLMESFGIKVERLSASSCESRLGVDGFVGGIRYVDDATVHPARLLQRMFELIPGVSLYEQTEVASIQNTEEGTRLVRTDLQTFEAPMVVLALNGYSASLHSYFKDKIFPTRGQILMTEPLPRFMEGSCYANFYLDYFRQIPTGEVLIGGFRQVEKDTEVGYSDHTTEAIQDALNGFIKKHVTKAASAKITHRWAGIMGFSVDGQPMVGSLPEDSQICFVGGYTGHGMGLAFHTAKCLVDMIYGREIPSFISARRF